MNSKFSLRLTKLRLHAALFLSFLLVYTVLFTDSSAQPGEQIRINTLSDSNALMQQIRQGKMLLPVNPDSAINLLRRAWEQSEASNFGKGTRNALLHLSRAHYLKQQYHQSIRMANALKQASDSLVNTDALFYAYYYTGLAHQRLENYPETFEAYTTALHYLNDTSNWTIVIYNNLGELFRVNNEPDKALDYFNQAFRFNQRTNGIHEVNLIGVYGNAARIYTFKGHFEKAAVYYDSAAAIALRYHQPERLFFIRLGQADLFNQRGAPKEALKYVEKARQIQADADYEFHNKHQPDFFAGEAYIRIPRYDLAEKYYLRALELVDSNRLNERMVLTHKLSNLYDLTGDCGKAYSFHIASHNLLEEFKNKEVQVKLHDAEVRYQTAEKDKAIALKNMQLLESKRNLARKNLWIVSSTSGAIILALLLLGMYRNYRRKRQMAQKEEEIARLRAVMDGEEKERVRLARELHDGVGSMLAAIKMNVGSIKSAYADLPVSTRLDSVVNMLQETSAEVRTTAHNLMPDVLTRYNLQEAVIQYIQKVNQSHDILIEFHIPEAIRDLDKPAELVLYRMIQELVQNVLKHAEASKIEIQLVQLENEITLTVEDNGKGMRNGAGLSDTGYGLDNLKYRIQALQGQLIIDSTPGMGTSVIISFDREKLVKVSS